MNNSLFDSEQERYYSWWLDELVKAGFVDHYKLQPSPFALGAKTIHTYLQQLKTKTKVVEETIMRPHVYTPDARIVWTAQAENIFVTTNSFDQKIYKRQYQQLDIGHGDPGALHSYTEVKPAFDMQNMTRLMVLNQKWVWQRYGTYINIRKIPNHFEQTFTPIRYMFTNKTGEPRKLNYKAQTLNEFLEKWQLKYM